MGKFKMPTVQQFLEKKTIYGPKKDPVWVYLEREMRENIDKKPYNEKVGAWLKFLKDLRYYYFCEAKRKERRLQSEVGPSWYLELSSCQREALRDLKHNIHQDVIEDLPNRTRRSLSDLGVTLKIPKATLMRAMADSVEDPGIFIWNLYKAVYKMSPSELRGMYDINAMILMSCLVFIDLEECIESLEKLTEFKMQPAPPPKKKENKNYQPKCLYGEYLQQCYIPFYCNHGKKKKSKPKPLGCKFRLRSEESYERLIMDHHFLEKRKERNKQEKQSERVCHYKFWEPPSSLRNTDPKMAAYVNALKMIKIKAKAKHKAPYKNVQFNVGGVSFTGGKPHYVLTNLAQMPTGYEPINGGTVVYQGEYVTLILGFWKFVKVAKEDCEETCDCLKIWDKAVKKYVTESKCKCNHFYDFYHEGKSKERYFYPATRHGPCWFDKAKIYQMDPVEDFIKDAVLEAVTSPGPTPTPSAPSISASSLSAKVLLAAFLADLSDSPLLIPHLPQANLLNNLQEWVRNRVRGAITPRQHRTWKLRSQRRWVDLSHIDYRARAYKIPFTLKELEQMNWSHRHLVQRLFKILLQDFESRNRLKQVEQTRLWWATTKYDGYPSKPFLDIFFTYMPARMKDTFMINPYSSELTAKYGAKTCPL